MSDHVPLSRPAWRLAAALDAFEDDDWMHSGVLYGWLDAASRAPQRTMFVGALPAAPVLAVGVVSIGEGHCVEGDDRVGLDKRLVRVTIAVSCCDAVAAIRDADGCHLHAVTSGYTVDVLRSAVSLQMCTNCVAQRVG